jgi:hypothetical protein
MENGRNIIKGTKKHRLQILVLDCSYHSPYGSQRTSLEERNPIRDRNFTCMCGVYCVKVLICNAPKRRGSWRGKRGASSLSFIIRVCFSSSTDFDECKTLNLQDPILFRIPNRIDCLLLFLITGYPLDSFRG